MPDSRGTLENSGERSQVKKIFKRVAVVERVCVRESERGTEREERE